MSDDRLIKIGAGIVVGGKLSLGAIQNVAVILGQYLLFFWCGMAIICDHFPDVPFHGEAKFLL